MATRAAAAAVAALAAGLFVSWLGASWLRSAVPEAGMLWRVAPPAKVAVWTLAGAHGATLHLEAGAQADERIGRIGDRIGGLIGRDIGGEDALSAQLAEADVRLSSLTVLAVIALALVFVVRTGGASTRGDVAVAAAAAGGIYGAGLGALSAAAQARLGFDLRIVSAGVEASVSPILAAILGAAWGACFAAIGALSSPAMRAQLPARWRALGSGLLRAALVASAAAAACLIVLALTQRSGGGIGIDPSLAALGVVLLGVNVIAAAVVLAHGSVMQIALDAGPLAEWSQLGYVTEQGDRALSPARWVFVVVPLIAGLAAGRAMRKREGSTSDAFRLAASFGVLWGIALTVITFLLRVRVLSNFALGSLNEGGEVVIDPLITFVLAAVWGGITSYVGLVAGAEEREPVPAASAAAPDEQPCLSCGELVPAGDRFCSWCGQLQT